MPRLKTKTIDPAPRKYSRRSEEQRIADLEAKIEALKTRARARTDPALRYVAKAVKAIDEAFSNAGDPAMRRALQEARHTLGACLQLQGVAVPRGGSTGASVDAEAVLAYVEKNPGQRSEHLAAGLGTDSTGLRRTMKQLVAQGKINTKGERRGMQYWAG
jgi:predicted ArsR family transcriptional regulator